MILLLSSGRAVSMESLENMSAHIHGVIVRYLLQRPAIDTIW